MLIETSLNSSSSLSVAKSGYLGSSVFSIAPMMDCTDRHFRYLARLMSKRTRLYTEMVTTGAILFGDRDRFLRFNIEEHPVALQLGGCDPGQLAECASIAEQYGYDEVNLNVGCPSDRVQAGRFGACLMLDPALVADCIATMQQRVKIPVSVKCRLGVDEQDPSEALPAFVRTVWQAGCTRFIVHARKAWLKGLSPRENREIPPLDYGCVYKLKQSFPELHISINGAILSPGHAADHWRYVDGAMLGRAVYANPYLLARVDAQLFGDKARVLTRDKIGDLYIEYMAKERRDNDIYLKHMARHMLGLYHGQPGAKGWRQSLSEGVRSPAAGIDVVEQARQHVMRQLVA